MDLLELLFILLGGCVVGWFIYTLGYHQGGIDMATKYLDKLPRVDGYGG